MVLDTTPAFSPLDGVSLEAVCQSVADNTPPLAPDVTVVIPTLGRPILESSLAALVGGSAWPARIIVVDQGCKQQVASWLELIASYGLPTEYVASTDTGRAAGVNRGLERVQTRFVIVTDDDCFVDRDWVRNMGQRLSDMPDRVVSGRVHAAGEETVAITVESDRERIQRRPGLMFDAMCGGNMGTSMDVVNRVGPFDESPYLATAEDGDWSYRALTAGVPLVYAPEVIVTHYGWRGEAERAEQFASYARSHGGFYGKHLRRGDLFMVLRIVAHHLRALRRWLRGTLRGDPEQADIGRAYTLGLLPGILAGWRGAQH